MIIEISKIQVAANRPWAVQESVQALADSIAEVGLINPITVDKKYNLIAGLHRLEAVKLLKWDQIECTVTNLDGLQKELAEIDENFVRNKLTPLERGDLLLRRKEIYEAIHPETKNGIAQAAAMHRGERPVTENFSVTGTAKAFAEDIAEKLNITPRTVRLQIQAAKDMTPEAKQIIRESGAKLTQRDAVALSKLSAERQQEAAQRIAEGSIQDVPSYLRYEKQKEFDENLTQKAVISEDGTELPFRMITGHYATFAESVADLKNVDKDCSSSPDMFLAEFTSFVRQFLPQIQWYSKDYYMPVFPELTDKQMNYLRGQIEIMCSAADDLYTLIERTRKNELQKKTRSAKGGKSGSTGADSNPSA